MICAKAMFFFIFPHLKFGIVVRPLKSCIVVAYDRYTYHTMFDSVSFVLKDKNRTKKERIVIQFWAL